MLVVLFVHAIENGNIPRTPRESWIMPYDHSTKIGNQGDVVKHAVLAAVVDWLLQDRGKPFTYVETHTGRAEYTLPTEGEWQTGIGELQKRVLGAAPGPLTPYLEHTLVTEVIATQKYPGSSGLVLRMLRAEEAPFRFTLYETDPSAASDLVRFYHSWPEVTVIQSDGLQGILGVTEASLVLLDPPDPGQGKKIKAVMAHLSNQEIPFLCWIPWDNRLLGEAAAIYRDVERYSPIRVKWDRRAEAGFVGSQIIVSPPDLYPIAHGAVSAVCKSMGWELAERPSG
jgi:23S rRNA A2030 N6-methylase RlmJ